MLNGVMLNVIMLNVVLLNGIMLNDIVLSVIMLNVVMLTVVTLSVVAPLNQKQSEKGNGREPKNSLGRVFNSKLDSFVQLHSKRVGRLQPLLELKTLPRFCLAH
jgi:hypothetical protein